MSKNKRGATNVVAFTENPVNATVATDIDFTFDRLSYRAPIFKKQERQFAMPRRIDEPTRVAAAGNKVKVIEEFIGRVNTKETRISVALMQSPAGWQEPGQRPEFDEYTLVLEGSLVVEHSDGVIEVRSGQAVEAKAGEWVRYRTPKGAKYVAICLPAFSPDTVHRDT